MRLRSSLVLFLLNTTIMIMFTFVRLAPGGSDYARTWRVCSGATGLVLQYANDSLGRFYTLEPQY